MFQVFSYEKSKSDTMGYHQTYLDIYEFNTNTRTTIYSDGIVFVAPRPLLKQSSGVFIDGYDISESVELERRPKRASIFHSTFTRDQQRKCLVKCTRVDYLRSKWPARFIGSNRAREKCTLDCIFSTQTYKS